MEQNIEKIYLTKDKKHFYYQHTKCRGKLDDRSYTFCPWCGERLNKDFSERYNYFLRGDGA